jgi:exopolysaccharide biosynthesis predicted pyruvyltransferase EpsI
MQEKIDEIDLKEFLKEYSDREVDFYRFPGNYGDSVIFHGTKTLLGGLKISINLVELQSEVKNPVLFVDGGGNFIDVYSDVYDFLTIKFKKYDKIIILPHTINGLKATELIQKFGTGVTIFSREKVSYSFLKKIKTNANIYLWHDCAFYNDLSDYPKIGSGVLNAFRIDVESIYKDLPSDNEDISFNGWAMKPLDDFINKILPFEEVRTDRLHVAITASLLGKRVFMYSNSYYKNVAVYDYSLKNNQNTVFIYPFIEKLHGRTIEEIFMNALENKNERSYNMYDIYHDLIFFNYELWKYEDKARAFPAG